MKTTEADYKWLDDLATEGFYESRRGGGVYEFAATFDMSLVGHYDGQDIGCWPWWGFTINHPRPGQQYVIAEYIEGGTWRWMFDDAKDRDKALRLLVLRAWESVGEQPPEGFGDEQKGNK